MKHFHASTCLNNLKAAIANYLTINALPIDISACLTAINTANKASKAEKSQLTFICRSIYAIDDFLQQEKYDTAKIVFWELHTTLHLLINTDKSRLVELKVNHTKLLTHPFDAENSAVAFFSGSELKPLLEPIFKSIDLTSVKAEFAESKQNEVKHDENANLYQASETHGL